MRKPAAPGRSHTERSRRSDRRTGTIQLRQRPELPGAAGGPGYQNQGSSNFGITPRSIPVAIILTIVTCGIYGLYWLIKLNDEVNQLSGEYQATSGGMVLVFTIITCGIYGWYWLYKMGDRCDRIKGMNGSSGILYLILGIFGLSIVSYCLIQDTINKAIGA